VSVQEMEQRTTDEAGHPWRWVPVCRFDDLLPERGAAALVDGVQIALVRLVDASVHAVQNLDPFSGAHVISRGIVGTKGDVPTIASPMYKQVFSLLTGVCLETAGYRPKGGRAPDLRVWPVEVVDGVVLVGVEGTAGPAAPESGSAGGGQVSR
jgi:nitrite reductase (NADH) small subunit